MIINEDKTKIHVSHVEKESPLIQPLVDFTDAITTGDKRGKSKMGTSTLLSRDLIANPETKLPKHMMDAFPNKIIPMPTRGFEIGRAHV